MLPGKLDLYAAKSEVVCAITTSEERFITLQLTSFWQLPLHRICSLQKKKTYFLICDYRERSEYLDNTNRVYFVIYTMTRSIP